MKTFILGLAVALAMPVAAHAADPQPKDHAQHEKKDCCCCDGDAADKPCCERMKAKAGADAKDPHAGHNMPQTPQK